MNGRLINILNALIILVAGDEGELFNRIIRNYDKSIRPQRNGSITAITVYPTLFYLLTMNEVEQTIRFSIDFTFTWYDPIIAWNPTTTKESNRTSLKIPEYYLWQADIAIFSRYLNFLFFKHLITSISRTDLIPYNKRMIQVSYEGKVVKSGPQVVANPCKVEISNFPFDKQVCEFRMGPWSYTNTEVVLLTPFTHFEPSSDFLGNSEWEFLNMSVARRIEDIYEEGDYDELVFTLKLKRKSTFYVLAIIIPTFACTTLCLFGFFLPSDITTFRTEKASLGISSLLAMALILETVTANMPKSSKLPLLGFFVLFEIILCAVAMCVSCVLCFLHERATTRQWRPSLRLQKLFLYRRYDRKIRHQDASFQSSKQTDNSSLEVALKKICNFLRGSISDEKIQDMWSRIFERTDVISLILFQAINVIATLIILI